MRPLQTRRLLAEDVADRIREEILAGRVGQGERLVEAVIAEELGVSRGPVREALKLLRGEGLVIEEPHRGAFVARLSAADVRDIFDLRAALEVARRQAARRAAHAIRHPRPCAGCSNGWRQAAKDGDAGHVLQADLAFHEGVCRLAGNRRLLEVYVRYVPVIKNLMKLEELACRDFDDAAREHEPMLRGHRGRRCRPGGGALQQRTPSRHATMLVAHIESLPQHGL